MPGKAAAAFVLGEMAKELPIRRVVDMGAGCGTYRRLLGPYLPDAHWTAVEIWAPYIAQFGLAALYDEVHHGDAASFDFASSDLGGLILFGDMVEHIPIYRVGDMVGAALERFDIALLSIRTGDWPPEMAGGNPHEAHLDSWFIEDIGRRFAPTLAGLIEHKLSDQRSVAVVFLGRTDAIRAALAARIAAFQDQLARDPTLDRCGLELRPDYLNPGVLARFHGKMRPLLGLPSPFAGQFADLSRFLEIKSVADAGCGDFGWMQDLSERFTLYLGIDRDASLIADLDQRFGARRGHFFACRDVTLHPLPAVDAILCRDLFAGQTVAAVQAILANIKASGARYVLASTIPGGPAPLDLTAPPFNLPLPLIQFGDERHPGCLMGAWTIPGR